jgi:uncharacterized protein (TIGR04255 family)
MTGMDLPGLPEFDRPPLIETILGVHFKPIRGLTTAHLGFFWDALGRNEWPALRELGPITPQIERFDVSPSAPSRLMFKQIEEPEVRLRISSQDESKVVQVQPNLLQTHWVRKPGTAYPRYEQFTKPGFLAIWQKFSVFLKTQGFSEPDLLQWEVTYINRIPAGKGELWETQHDWAAIFNGVMVPPSIPDGAVESARASYHYRLQEDCGRLHAEIRHVLSGDGGPESLDLTLTARGQVPSASRDQGLSDAHTMQLRISDGLDIGRRAIVNAFKAFASKKALDFWGHKEETADA